MKVKLKSVKLMKKYKDGLLDEEEKNRFLKYIVEDMALILSDLKEIKGIAESQFKFSGDNLKNSDYEIEKIRSWEDEEAVLNYELAMYDMSKRILEVYKGRW